jgi:hypothetical protein
VVLLRERSMKRTFRALVCTTDESLAALDGCSEVFSTLAAIPFEQLAPPPSLTSQARGPDRTAAASQPWSGVSLPAPSGCTAPEPGLLECPDALLLWADAPDEESLDRRVVLGRLIAERSGPDVVPEERPCLLEGQPSTCTVVSTHMGGRRASVTVAVGAVQRRRTSLQCVDFSDDAGASIPALCSPVLAWPRPTSPK